jgi:hypothetical protein
MYLHSNKINFNLRTSYAFAKVLAILSPDKYRHPTESIFQCNKPEKPKALGCDVSDGNDIWAILGEKAMSPVSMFF